MNKKIISRTLEIITQGVQGNMSGRMSAAALEVFEKNRNWATGQGVQGMGIARRITAGDVLKGTVFKVYVDRKRPLSALSDAVPSRISIPGFDKQIEVDVEAIGKLQLEGFIRRDPPAMPGDAIGLEDSAEGTGTLGCLVRKRGDRRNLYLLSNAHVIAMDGLAGPGYPVLRPSGEKGGQLPGDLFAEYEEAEEIIFSKKGFYNTTDAAIARILNPESVSPEIPHLGIPTGVSGDLFPGMRVRKSGAIGGYKEGRVKDIDFCCALNYRHPDGGSKRAGFRRQVLCTDYTEPGDSGSAVLNTKKKVVGLHFCGSDSTPNRCSIFSPIHFALQGLSIEVVTQPIFDNMVNVTPETLEVEPQTENWIAPLKTTHRYRNSIPWRLTNRGVEVDGKIEFTPGRLVTVPRVWNQFGPDICHRAEAYQVPVELIIATLCTETQGDPTKIREEPGYVSDEISPHRVSVGLMQTLISTARGALGDQEVDRLWLLEPGNSIQAGTAYIKHQQSITNFDPPKVACAYNAGGIIENISPENRWQLRQYPIGSGAHADRFVLWFNDCFRFFQDLSEVPKMSFWHLLMS